MATPFPLNNSTASSRNTPSSRSRILRMSRRQGNTARGLSRLIFWVGSSGLKANWRSFLMMSPKCQLIQRKIRRYLLKRRRWGRRRSKGRKRRLRNWIKAIIKSLILCLTAPTNREINLPRSWWKRRKRLRSSWGGMIISSLSTLGASRISTQVLSTRISIRLLS